MVTRTVSVTARVPGMKPGHTLRNIFVGIVYLSLWPLVLVGLLLAIPIAIGTNYRDLANRLSRLPGIDTGGGVTSGVVAGLYLFVLVGLVGAVGGDPAGESSGDPTPTTPVATDAAAGDVTAAASSEADAGAASSPTSPSGDSTAASATGDERDTSAGSDPTQSTTATATADRKSVV